MAEPIALTAGSVIENVASCSQPMQGAAGTELHFIGRKFAHPADPTKVVLALDIGHLAVAEAEAIPKDAMCARIVWRPHDYDADYRVCGDVVGHIIPGDSEICGPDFKWVKHEREPLRLCTLTWGLHQRVFPRQMSHWLAGWPVPSEAEVVEMPDPSANQRHLFAWDQEHNRYLVFSSEDSGASVGREAPWNFLGQQLAAMDGSYAPLFCGGICYGVWNFASGCIMGPPYDRRFIEIYPQLPFARLIAEPKTEADLARARAAAVPPGCVKVLRSPHFMGYILD